MAIFWINANGWCFGARVGDRAARVSKRPPVGGTLLSRWTAPLRSRLGILCAAALLHALPLARGQEAHAAEAGDIEAMLRPAVAEGDVDWDNCTAWEGGRQVGKAPRDVLLVVLGLKAVQGEPPAWTTEPLGGVVRHFRIALARPVAAGTICTDFADEAASVAILKEGAACPGDVTDNAQWTALPSGSVKTLPKGTAVRALRLTHRYSPMPWNAGLVPSRLAGCLLLTGRFWDPARLGAGEWSRYSESQRKNAKTKAGPAADQWIGCWPKDLEIAGLAFVRQPAKDSRLACLPAGIEEHPLAIETSKWKDVSLSFASSGPAALALGGSLAARALRLRAQGYCKEPIWQYGYPFVSPLVALKEGEAVPATFLPPAPFTFSYQMPMDGFAAIGIRDAAGRDVRRLIAEVERSQGDVQEAWDLKDDKGSYVQPGTYTWRGICRPPLKLTYEATVYNAGHPPWFAPVRGGGGWMADHTPPQTICAVKDTLVIAAPGAEYGAGIIATDLEGNKIWNGPGHGAERLVSDGRYAYAVNNDSVVRLDPEHEYAQKKILDFQYTPEIPGHARGWILSDRSGAACHDGKLYVSYDAPGPAWIRSSVGAADVDLSRCFPPPSGEKTHETAYGPAERILGTFLTIQSSQQASFGKTAKKGPLKRTLVLALKQEVPVGSVLVPDGDIQVYALKPGQAIPARMNPKSGPNAALSGEARGGEDLDLDLEENVDARFDEATWVRLKAERGGQPGVAAPAAGTRTRLVAFTGTNLDTLDYALVLDRRYRNATPDARMIVLEGEKTAAGGWTTKRGPDLPISLNNPPTAGFVWDKPAPLRGFALLRPMEWAGVAVDVWDGTADAAITEASFKGETNWRQARIYHKSDNGVKFGWHTDKVILGDFGELLQVRALRVRIVEPPRAPLSTATSFAGGFQGLVAFQPIGNDIDLPKGLSERVTIVGLPQKDGDPAKVLGHVAVPHPGAMAFDKNGTLYIKSASGIVRVRDPSAQTDPGRSDVVIPLADGAVNGTRALAFDAAGLLYVLDGDAKTIKVFDPNGGKLVRTIGKPGGLGPWDPAHFDVPVAMAIDANGKLWVVEQHYQPKRISRWSRDGVFEKEFLGPTNYGGGGFMDPGDHTVVNHLGMKFRIDYAARTWKLESRYNGMNSRGAYSPDRIVRLRGHRYMVGDHNVVLPEFNDRGPTVVICEEKAGVAVPMAAAGLVSGLPQLGQGAELRQAFGSLDPDKTSFCWTDLNRDGQAQKEEVQIINGTRFRQSACVGEDLSLNFARCRLRPREIRADGLPLYDAQTLETVPELDGDAMVTAEGEAFVMQHKFLDREGKVIWTYPDQYGGVQRSNQTPFGFTQRPAGVLAGSLSALGHMKVGGEDLFCVNGNHGDYFAFTRDGLLAAAILGGPAGYGRRFFSTPECEPGKTDLSDLRATVEDFRGHVCLAEDGNVYAIAGKNHITVLRVDGLEKMKRVGGICEVTVKGVQEAMAWATEKTRIERALRRPSVCTVPYLTRKPKIDGDIFTDWPALQPMEIIKGRVVQGVAREGSTAALAFDAENLYIAVKAADESPMVNSGQDWKTCFQQGDGFDLHLGLDPAADPRRSEAAPGDIRLVFSAGAGAQTVVLYRYKVQGPRLGGEAAKFTSPVGETSVDEVLLLKGCAVEIRRAQKSWILEAAVPWKALGAKAPDKNVSLRGDVGILVSDPNGISTVTRFYWANRSTVVMSDLPSEARVIPSLWGELRFDVSRIDDEILGDDADGLK